MRFTFLLAALLVLIGVDAFAEGTIHWGGFPDPAGPIAAKVTEIYNFIFVITAIIALIVTVGLVYCIWKFRASKRRQAAKFSHSNLLEFTWTIIPVFICLALAVKSFTGITFIRTMPEEGLTVEVIAYQFGWEFDYPDYEISSPEPMEPHKQLSVEGTDRYVKKMIIPVGVPVKLHVTARDVIHAFYTPALGVKIDAMPGRINYQWFQADKPGEYIGQCAELCGSAHGEMFYIVKAVPQEEFKKWINARRLEAGLKSIKNIDLAAASINAE